MVLRSRAILFLAAASGLARPVTAAPATVAAGTPAAGSARLLAEAAHAQWDARLSLEGATATLALTGDGGRGYRLNLRPDGAALYRLDPAQTELARCGAPFASAAGAHELVLRRRSNMLYVVADGRRLLAAMDGTTAQGKLTTPTPGLKLADGGYQGVEDIAFADDFMRTKDQQQLGVWEHLGGKWRFYSVSETNPSADVRLSVNPFSLGLSPTEVPAAVLSGQRFWDDYDYQASVRCRGGGWGGVVFAARHGKDYWLLRADLREPTLEPRRVELVRVKDGRETVLARGAALLAAEQWYRLGTRLRGSRVQCLLDGDVIFDRVDPELAGGRVGLWTNGGGETLFDDVRCVSNFTWPFDREASLTAPGAVTSGKWRLASDEGDPIAGDPGPRKLVCGAGEPARWVVGDLAGDGFRCDARVRAEQHGVIGLVFGWRDATHWLAAEWDSAQGILRLVQADGGPKRPLGFVRDALAPGESHDIAVDLTLEGKVLVRRDGLLRLRTTLDPRPGRLGVSAEGTGATFSRLALRQAVPVDTEVDVDNAHFANDPFMLHWASPLADWYPAGGPENNPGWTAPPRDDGTVPSAAAARLIARGGRAAEAIRRPRPETPFVPSGPASIYWHKGDFYQAYRLEVPVNRGPVALLLNATEERWQPPDDKTMAGAPLRLETVKDKQHHGDGYSLFVTNPGADGAMLHLYRQGAHVLGRPLPVDVKTITVGHDGGVTWVEGNDRDLLVFHDARPLRGPRVALRAAHGPILWHIKCRREGIIDEVFEQAPAAWVQQGQWIITNRFSCTPTWSHMTALARRGLSAIWHKMAFPGNVTIEYYAGMRMQADLAYYYPRPGDFNVSFACQPFDLASGVSLLPGAWDPAWSGVWTKYVYGAETVVQTDRPLVPRTREGSGSRTIPVPYISAGRDVHGAWYYMKSRFVDGRLEGHFDNAKVLEAAAPEATGDRVAFWTQDDQIVIARVRITYADKTVPRRLVRREPVEPRPAPTPSLLVTVPNAQGLAFDWHDSLQGWAPRDVFRGVSLEAGNLEGKSCLLVRNHLPGDSFEAVLPLPSAGELEALPALRRRAYLVRPAAEPAPGLDVTRAALLRFDYRLPPEAKVNAYLTLNDRSFFIPLSGPSQSDEVLKSLGPTQAVTDGRWHTLTFDLGAALRQEFEQATVRLTDFRFGQRHEGYLLAGFGGNPVGAWYAIANFALVPEVGSAQPLEPTAQWLQGRAPAKAIKELRTAVDERPDAPPPASVPDSPLVTPDKAGVHWLHVQAQLADGALTPVSHMPLLVAPTEPPLEVADAGTPWDGGPVRLTFGDLMPSDVSLQVGEQSLAWAQAVRLDAASRRLTLDPRAAGLTFTDGERVPLRVTASYASGRRRQLAFERVYRHSADRLPPTLPTITGGGPRFDADSPLPPPTTYGGYTTVTVDPTTAPAPGGRSLRITNLRLAGPMQVPLLTGDLNLGQMPVLLFDYAMRPPVRSDLLLTVGSENYELGFTDHAGAYRMVGTIDDAQRDGSWRRATVNLQKLLATRVEFAPGMYQMSALSVGDLGYTGEAPGAAWNIDRVRLVRTVSGPRGFTLGWSAYDAGGIAGWRLDLSEREDAAPTTEAPATVTSRTFTGVPSGLRWFAVQARDTAGNWGPVARLPLLVSNATPKFAEAQPAPGPLGSSQLGMTVQGLEGADLDPASLQLTAGEKTVAVKPGDVDYDPVKARLTWHWAWATQQFSGRVADGAKLRFGVKAADFAGNAAQPATWDYTVSYAADKQAPPAPQVTIAEQPLARLETFIRGGQRYGWSSYQSLDGRDWDAERRDFVGHCVSGGNGVPLHIGAVDLEKHPYLSFDYKVAGGVVLHMLVYANSNWFSVSLNGKSRSYPEIGQVSLAVDGAWHTLCVDLRKMIRAAQPSAAKLNLDYLLLYEYGSGSGLNYWLDNIALFGPSPRGVTASWTNYDATGIGASALRLDPGLTAPAPATPTPDLASTTLTAGAAGAHLLQVQSRDGAGNLGGIARRVVVVP
jgi:hypothetical protein